MKNIEIWDKIFFFWKVFFFCFNITNILYKGITNISNKSYTAKSVECCKMFPYSIISYSIN